MTEYIERINEHVVILPYTLGTGSKLKKKYIFSHLREFIGSDHLTIFQATKNAAFGKHLIIHIAVRGGMQI